MQKKRGMILNQHVLRFIGRSKMILKFLKQLFCFPHHYEQELSPFDDEWWEDCRKCEKTRKVKKVII